MNSPTTPAMHKENEIKLRVDAQQFKSNITDHPKDIKSTHDIEQMYLEPSEVQEIFSLLREKQIPLKGGTYEDIEKLIQDKAEVKVRIRKSTKQKKSRNKDVKASYIVAFKVRLNKTSSIEIETDAKTKKHKKLVRDQFELRKNKATYEIITKIRRTLKLTLTRPQAKTGSLAMDMKKGNIPLTIEVDEFTNPELLGIFGGEVEFKKPHTAHLLRYIFEKYPNESFLSLPEKGVKIPSSRKIAKLLQVMKQAVQSLENSTLPELNAIQKQTKKTLKQIQVLLSMRAPQEGSIEPHNTALDDTKERLLTLLEEISKKIQQFHFERSLDTFGI